MKKLLSLIALSLVGLTSWGAVVFDFNADGLTMFEGITSVSTSDSHAGDFTVAKTTAKEGVKLTVNPSNANTPNRLWEDYNSKAVQLRLYGGSIVLEAPSGQMITSLVFDAPTWNAPTASTGIVSTKSWKGSAAEVTLTIGAKLFLNSITVTLGDGGGGDPDDPTVLKVDSLQKINDLADGTVFQFDELCYVNYQAGKYLYLQQNDDEGYCYAALIYGDIDQAYEVGDIIPAGWKGKKSTYKGLVEVVEVEDLDDSLGEIDEEWITPFDFTGYMAWLDEEWVNYKISFDNVSISDIDGKNFTMTSVEEDEDGEEIEVTLPGFNQFGIELPATEGTYYVEGMVSIYNGNIQLYPTVIEETMTPMWKVWYMGEDGDQFTIADELYVDYVDNDEKLIYFTDNATTIIYDVYADWGYVWEEEWSPDWMAMDCDGDDELFETIKKMRVIKAGTLRGTLEDNYTNPRFVVTEAPEEDLDAEYPNIVYDEYDLKKDSLEANGGEIVYITGVYNAGNLEGVIASSGVKQVVPIIPLAGQDPFKKGGEYTVKAVVLQKEPWEPANEDEDDEAAAAPSKVKAINAAKRPMKMAVRKTPRKMPVDDPQWFTNYELKTVEIINFPSSVDQVKTSKTVKEVQYVNAVGQMSGVPFSGVNIVIERYTDGTQNVSKMVRK